MRVTRLGVHTQVMMSRKDVDAFKTSYPCSGLPSRAITFEFDSRNGDLVDIFPDSARFDGPALLALSQDAQEFANKAKA
jgi:hypothetical protein